ncbi:sugar phosphate isomerase/epimerase [Arthrobacter sp. ISL-30]|uniref:sugar phosphate isomerase/epimerase family protein n=1 Tax=Arthrobacter sp. ISL-30 TaxID=2819109 RepID=UPI001BE83C96|nr:sugar phosphate isomerase/epimerase family protein [Arthrobacter sp. ISL-30]MBT2512382.1 sugar phosphate isomerase/epimerase [Arthrobacter sp. ISL-30]
MKFGVHSYMIVDNIDRRTIDEMAGTAASWGVQGVEVHMDRAEDLPRLELKKVAARHGVDRTLGVVLTAENSLVSPDPEVRQAGVEHITSAIHAAADVGANNIGGVLSAAGRVFTGQPATETELERVVDGLSKVAPIAEAHDVTVSVEATSRYLGYVLNTAAQARSLLDRVGSTHVQVQLDTFHMNIEEASVPQGILDAGGRLGYVQIAESHRGLLGSGHIPWAEVMEALRSVDYDGWLTFEAFTPAHPSIAAKSNTWRHLCTEQAMVTEGIEYLRGLI